MDTNHWTDKEGITHYIPEMDDAHLFFLQEDLVKVVRMKRRERIEELKEAITLIDSTIFNQESANVQDVKNLIQHELDAVLDTKTLDFGRTIFPQFEAIMNEAIKRGMRDV